MIWDRAIRAVLLVAAVLAACDGTPAGPPDAGEPGPDAGTSFEPAPPEAVQPPAPPRLAPCPAGWREIAPVVTGGAAACDPWPAGGVQTCPPDSAHFPGEPGCSRLGSACPAGDWAENLPANQPVVFARAGAPAGGNGTRAAPYGSIAEALAVAPAGSVVALSKGTFDEAVRLSRNVTLWGACVDRTLLTSSVATVSAGTATAAGTGGGLRQLRVSGRRIGVWATTAGAAIDLADVLVSGTEGMGMLVAAGGKVTGRGLAVRSTGPRAGVGDFGRGIGVEQGGQVDLSRVVVESNREAGVVATGAGSVVNLTDASVRDTQPRQSDGSWGRGLSVERAARLTLTRAAVERNREAGILLATGGSATFASVVVRQTQPRASDNQAGNGVVVDGASTVEGSGCLVERNRGFGFYAREAGTLVRLTDCVVRDTQGFDQSDGDGAGFFVFSGARAELTRCAFERNRIVGVAADDAGTLLALSDVAVRDGEGSLSAGVGGTGVQVNAGAQATLMRVVSERNRRAGVLVDQAGSRLTAFDLAVHGTRSQASDRAAGQGLSVVRGGRADVVRAVVEANREVGVLVASASTSAQLADVVVRDTEASEATGLWGRGIQVQFGARLNANRVVVERNREVSVAAADAASVLQLSDVVVRDTRKRACLPACEDRGGSGAMAALDGSIVLSRFVVANNPQCGVQLGRGGTVDLHVGEVRNNVIGANVQTDGFDLGRLQDQVVFRDNQRDLESLTLPLPDPGIPLPQ